VQGEPIARMRTSATVRPTTQCQPDLLTIGTSAAQPSEPADGPPIPDRYKTYSKTPRSWACQPRPKSRSEQFSRSPRDPGDVRLMRGVMRGESPTHVRLEPPAAVLWLRSHEGLSGVARGAHSPRRDEICRGSQAVGERMPARGRVASGVGGPSTSCVRRPRGIRRGRDGRQPEASE